jgi:hypothetical protein
MPSKEELKRELEAELTHLGESIRHDLWKPGDERFLGQIASNIVNLGGKILDADSDERKSRYRNEIELLTNHVAVLAHARANIAHKELEDTVLRILEKAAEFLVSLILSKLGVEGVVASARRDARGV